MKQERDRKPTFDPEYIRDISETVYRAMLEQNCSGDVARMIAKDKDGGEKLRNRAGYYDRLTRAYLTVLGFDPVTQGSTETFLGSNRRDA